MAANLSGIVIAPPTGREKAAAIYRKLRRLPLLPVFLLSLVVIAGVFAPILAPHDPEKGELRERNIPPAWSGGEKEQKLVVERMSINERTTSVTLSDALKVNPDAKIGDTIDIFTRPEGSTKFLLGTDHLGRDVLSRVIYGARISLLVSIVTLAVGGSIGVTMGLAAGWYGGVIDEFLMRLVDIKLAIPLILIALVLVITLGQSLWIIVTVLCLFIWPRFARQVRGEVLQLKHMDYVSLAKVSGASTARILFIHIFPGTINTLIVVATLQVGIVILLEIYPKLPWCWRSASNPGMGIDGFRWSRQVGRRRLVDIYIPRSRYHGYSNVVEPVRRLAPRHVGPTITPTGVTGTHWD